MPSFSPLTTILLVVIALSSRKCYSRSEINNKLIGWDVDSLSEETGGAAITNEKYDSPATSSCPQGTSTIDIDFNTGVDDFGESQGTLRFTGKNGFVVYFTSDKSNGNHGGLARGVHITNKNYGNCHASNNCAYAPSSSSNLVLGALNAPYDVNSINVHSSGIVAVFNQGATRVSFQDSDDDGTKKAVFAYNKDGELIGQSAFASRQAVAIDTSQTTGGQLIYAVEFDTGSGSDGGSNDGTYFTVDDFHVEGVCSETQESGNPLAPCISTCSENQYVKGCSASS